ncbi:5-oxoprolinase subunit C family protein [Pontibacter arcticus]|uniref:KipI antagonist n=1 Tax=Pontibacter arcticus TaxID=2080288 RepID=A0A364RF77_9BACT|nr:biotin-dependent carboxyltransferase family protein [Pontibacter arcticus]RAU82934.1 KipI antagonist [Pontibacter arcticus]
MSIKVLKPGLLSTIQDTGRYGYQKEGIMVSGAMDEVAIRIANLLIGNDQQAAALEVTLLGPTLYFEADCLIAITGADLSPSINGKPVKLWRPTLVKRNSTLAFGAPVRGCRAYIAVGGGFDVPEIMGSYATYLRAGIGGFKGRALQTGDILTCCKPVGNPKLHWEQLQETIGIGDYAQTTWSPSPELYPTYEHNSTIRAVKGPDYELFPSSSQEYLWTEKFMITTASDRMGYRLQGMPLSLTENKEMLSSAVTFGTIQVPAQGQLIILMADHQTTGGYPRIAQVITADLSQLAQVQPGKFIRFEETTLEKAQQLFIEQEQKIEQLKWALQFKINH